ncbi:unnamed protein product [Closterium sp. NIES-54]
MAARIASKAVLLGRALRFGGGGAARLGSAAELGGVARLGGAARLTRDGCRGGPGLWSSWWARSRWSSWWSRSSWSSRSWSSWWSGSSRSWRSCSWKPWAPRSWGSSSSWRVAPTGAVLLELEVLPVLEVLLLLGVLEPRVPKVLVLEVLELLGLVVLLVLELLVELELVVLLVELERVVLLVELELVVLLEWVLLEVLEPERLCLLVVLLELELLEVLELVVLLELELMLGVLVLSLLVLEVLRGRGQCPPPVQSESQLQLVSPLPAPSPYAGPTGGLAERRAPESRPASPVRTARTSRRVPRPHPPAVPGTHQMAIRPSTAPQHVPLPSPPESSLPALADPASDSLRAASPTVTRLLATVVIGPSFESTAASTLVTELVDFAAHSRLDYATSLVAESESVCPPSVGGRHSRHRFWFSSCMCSYILPSSFHSHASVHPPCRSGGARSPPVFKARYVARGFSQWQGVDYFQTFSPTPKMTTLRVLLHVAAQRDYELHSLDFSIAFLQGSLHEEVWLCRPPGFAPTLCCCRSTSSYLGELRSYLGLQITRDRARRTITLTQSHMVQQVLQHFDFSYSSPQATPLSTRHSLSALPSDESVEPSGLYPELVGCLMYLITCTRPDLAYPLSILARYVAPGRHRPEHMAAAKRVLRYLCSTSGLGLVLGGRSPVVLTGHADASWVDDLATQRSSQGYTFSLGSGSVSWQSTRSSSVLSSSCEAEIYAGAMAAQELRWLTYLLTDLGEPPRSPPVLYVDNKAMLALSREHRLEHRTKHIALRYFLARELQQRGQLRLSYVASQANTADIFTMALQPCDHQRFCTMLGLLPTWPHLLTS